MVGIASSWIYDGSAAERLWQKSAIGRPLNDGSLELSPVETIFVHHHRNLDLPTGDWMINALSENSLLLQEYSVLEALRVPGNKIVLMRNMELFPHNIQPQSWAARAATNPSGPEH